MEKLDDTDIKRNLEEDEIPGKILHLDGDRHYSQKAFKYYQEIGITAIVKNIPENIQPVMVYKLLSYYKPDILVIKSDLVIFAGACESYFEALMQAGANFASSPDRILIDILDPLIVAKEVAITDSFKYINMNDIEGKLRDGRRGVGGIGAMRKENKKGLKNKLLK